MESDTGESVWIEHKPCALNPRMGMRLKPCSTKALAGYCHWYSPIQEDTMRLILGDVFSSELFYDLTTGALERTLFEKYHDYQNVVKGRPWQTIKLRYNRLRIRGEVLSSKKLSRKERIELISRAHELLDTIDEGDPLRTEVLGVILVLCDGHARIMFMSQAVKKLSALETQIRKPLTMDRLKTNLAMLPAQMRKDVVSHLLSAMTSKQIMEVIPEESGVRNILRTMRQVSAKQLRENRESQGAVSAFTFYPERLVLEGEDEKP